MSEPLVPWRAFVARVLAGDPGARRLAIAGAVGVLAVVAGVGGLAYAHAAAAPIEASLPRADRGATSASVDGSSTTLPGTGADGPVVADAAGAVVHPGVYRLSSGARVADLITAAGGPSADADLDAVNLAARVNDGDRVYVPHHGEVAAAALASGVTSGAAGASGSGATAVVDLNTATLDQLDALPGIGPSTAQAILDYRRQHGRFRTVDELLQVRGIGDAKLRQIRPHVRV